MSRSPGTPITFRKPVFVGGLRETKSESLGSTSGNMAEYGATIITATATGLVYTLPAPKPGLVKFVSVNFTGQTDPLVIACQTTLQGFDGSTHNIITVTSSQEHGAFLFYGMSTAQWMAFMGSRGRARSASTAIAADDFVFSGSTIKSSTDRT
jgi:hypothetical protein